MLLSNLLSFLLSIFQKQLHHVGQFCQHPFHRVVPAKDCGNGVGQKFFPEVHNFQAGKLGQKGIAEVAVYGDSNAAI